MCYNFRFVEWLRSFEIGFDRKIKMKRFLIICVFISKNNRTIFFLFMNAINLIYIKPLQYQNLSVIKKNRLYVQLYPLLLVTKHLHFAL